MSRGGEHGTTQPVPAGPVAAANHRKEALDAAPREGKRERRPDPDDSDVEVIALSPRTLTAAGPFACDACGNGFLREQSLQLRRRGHSHAHDDPRLPRNVRKRAYVCPEASCPRRDPGDLAGIRNHYRRRHGGAGRKWKWKCDLCGERHGAEHDWEAHARVCGARKYGCSGCGAAFSGQDSFVTHRAFCDGRARRRENVATVASGLQRLALPSRADGHGSADGASGLGPDKRTPASARGRISGCRW